jgi:flavin-dependent dehydrogenase
MAGRFDADVLIAGGGPAGSAAAIAVRDVGRRCIIVGAFGASLRYGTSSKFRPLRTRLLSGRERQEITRKLTIT